MKEWDEPLLNTILILMSTMGVKYIDENISCKRIDIIRTNNYKTFNNFVYSMQDFVNASYGYDNACVQWSNCFKLIFLVITILGLIYQINYIHYYFQKNDYIKMHTVMTFTKKV